MISSNGRYVVTFNGEIYNFKDIKKNIENILITKFGRVIQTQKCCVKVFNFMD